MLNSKSYFKVTFFCTAFSDDTIKWSHSGRLINFPSGMLGGARYSCCYRKQIKRGCQAKWECCQGDPGGIGCRTRYTCCKNDIAVEGSDVGCQKRYSCCRGRMEDEGCTQVKNFISLHDKNTEEFKICERGGGGDSTKQD